MDNTDTKALWDRKYEEGLPSLTKPYTELQYGPPAPPSAPVGTITEYSATLLSG